MRHTLARLLAAALVVAVAATTTGCGTVHRFLSRDESEQRAQELQDLQLKVMRFADEYSGRIYEPVQRFTTAAQATPEDRLRAQSWRLTQATSAYTIASGPNPTVNALDMIVLATLSRMVLEDYWVGELYRQRASPLLEVHRRLEHEAWTLVDDVLTEEQDAQLRAIIQAWRTAHPKTRAVAHVHFTSFARSLGQPVDSGSHPRGSLFALFGLDPLSDLDPAVREIEQTRLLAERTIYYLQRAPNLLDMQVERLAYQLAVMPEAKDALADVDRISLAAAAAGELANNLPAIVARERHATIAQLTATLDAEQAQLGALLRELRKTLDAGSSASESIESTIRTIDALATRFAKKDSRPAEEQGRPFDITQYAATARDVSAAAQSLEALVAQMESSSSSVERLAASASRDLRGVVDYAYWRAVCLIVISAAAALAAMLAYRVLMRRIR